MIIFLRVSIALTALELFIFLIVMNMVKTDDLETLRDYDIIRNVTVIACCAQFLRVLIYFIIDIIPEEKEGTNSNISSQEVEKYEKVSTDTQSV